MASQEDNKYFMYPWRMRGAVTADYLKKTQYYYLSEADINIIRRWIPEAQIDCPYLNKIEGILLTKCGCSPDQTQNLSWHQILSILAQTEPPLQESKNNNSPEKKNETLPEEAPPLLKYIKWLFNHGWKHKKYCTLAIIVFFLLVTIKHFSPNICNGISSFFKKSEEIKVPNKPNPPEITVSSDQDEIGEQPIPEEPEMECTLSKFDLKEIISNKVELGEITKDDADKLLGMVEKAYMSDLKLFFKHKNTTSNDIKESLLDSRIFMIKNPGGGGGNSIFANGSPRSYRITTHGEMLCRIANDAEAQRAIRFTSLNAKKLYGGDESKDIDFICLKLFTSKDSQDEEPLYKAIATVKLGENTKDEGLFKPYFIPENYEKERLFAQVWVCGKNGKELKEIESEEGVASIILSEEGGELKFKDSEESKVVKILPDVVEYSLIYRVSQ